MPGATGKGLPYPLTSENNAAAGAVQSLATALDPVTFSAGDIKESVRAAAETGWALMNGQTITNAQTLNAALWAACPTSWRSGANLILPNWCDGYVMRGAGEAGATLGASTGSNTTALTTTELPAHSHTVSHSHTTTGTAAGAGAHGHSIAHDHGSVSTAGSDGSHTHGAGNYWSHGVGSFYLNLTGYVNGFSVLSNGLTNPQTDAGTSAHQHTVDLPNFTGNTSGDPGNHTHSCSGTTSTDVPTTTSVGTGTAFSTRGKSAWINFFIKL